MNKEKNATFVSRMVIYVLLSLVAWLTGTLIRYADLRLLTGNYHFHLGKWQWVTYCLCILAVGLTLWELVRKLFPGGESVNATRLVVRALELRILDIDNLEPDME